MRTLTTITLLFLLTSCSPDLCEDCYTVKYEDGTSERICVEYDCSQDYYY